MLTTIEKVLIFKTTDMLSGIRDELLGEIARRSAQVSLEKGERLFAEGEVGSSMFIVVSGRLSIMSQGQLLEEVGDRAVVGELAALDPEPRTTTVTAVAPTTLLKISNNDLNLLMTADIEVARSFITILCRRLRA